MTAREEYSLPSRIKREAMSFSGVMGVYADDMRGGVVEIEADAEFETASTIKSFILADLYSQTASGAKSMSDVLTNDAEYYVNGSGMLKSLEPGTPMSVKNLATLMIIVSDNIATNMLIDYLGMNHINATISGLGFKKTRLHRKIADGYSGEGHWPPLGTTTPREYGEFFAMLARGELVSPESSREMISIFKKQHYNSTLTNWLPPYYLDEDNFGNDGTEIYVASKSGSMDDCRNDGGIIGTPYGSYVVAIMTKGFHDRQYHREHESHIYGARVSRLLFDQYLALEGRF